MENRKKLIVLGSCVIAALALLAVSLWMYYTPYMYVSLDVNPSIEFSVNRYNLVLDATAVNDDGSEILSSLDLANKPIDDAVAETVQAISVEGYFDGNTEGGVVISTSSDNEEDAANLANQLQTNVEQQTEESGKDVAVESLNVATERVAEAHELGTTPGKLNLIQKLQASSSDPDSIVYEDWINKPVKEFMKTIKDNRKANGQGEEEQEQEQEQEGQETASAVTTGGNSTTDETANENSTKNGKKKDQITTGAQTSETEITEQDQETTTTVMESEEEESSEAASVPGQTSNTKAENQKKNK